MKVSVLGAEYEIVFCRREEDGHLNKADGYTDWTMRKIVVCEVESEADSVGDLKAYQRKVLRHEIVHAFFMESGLMENSVGTDCIGMDETICDWIAIQGPKIYAAWESVLAV